ncbi:MAG: phage tail sheath C-terminal domain-containing protein [Bacteroidota bacterium]
MSSFLTPGVYTEEVPTLPPSVANVSTAIPAFIGYTEKSVKEGKSVANQAVRISTLLEYKELFGTAQPATFTVVVNDQDDVENVTVASPQHTLSHAIDLYFKNGGGDCYIISIGTHAEVQSKEAFLTGLEALSKEDEPTLIMLGEATKLPENDYYEVCVAALTQCADLQDRFFILDVQNDDVEAFRNGIGISNLKYGAAYTPYLHTSLSYHYDENGVTIAGASAIDSWELAYDDLITVTYAGTGSPNPKLKIIQGGESTLSFSISQGVLTITGVAPSDGTVVSEVIAAWNDAISAGFDSEGFNIQPLNTTGMLTSSGSQTHNLTQVSTGATETLAGIKGTKSALYSKVVSELTKEKMALPPSAAVAGAYATTDRERGVWKAPANVSLNGVIAPTIKITSADQESLNVDPNAGKSINAIRGFIGKGTLVWGARTLAGNDNEWRYVSVRRLFNMIEESTKKATYFAVFESNDAVTWLKVKAMIESYLYGLWQQGGLTGATEEQAYFVNIGLGKTMTQQDVLEGRMIVEIGLAATRPAEFIILRFSHKLQEA